MRSWRVLALVACPSVALGVAGCGRAATPTAAPTQAQYIQSADAICRGLSHKSDALSAEVNVVKLSAEAALREAKKNAEEADTQLRALPTPAGGASTITEWLHWREVATASSGPIGESNFKLDIDATKRADGIAQGYGLKACAELPESSSSASTHATSHTAESSTTERVARTAAGLRARMLALFQDERRNDAEAACRLLTAAAQAALAHEEGTSTCPAAFLKIWRPEAGVSPEAERESVRADEAEVGKRSIVIDGNQAIVTDPNLNTTKEYTYTGDGWLFVRERASKSGR